MLASGNGRPEVCALNLLRITRGEVPYDRIKGLAGDLIDIPAGTAGTDAVIADAEWVLSIYEPRVRSDTIDIDSTLSTIGDFGLSANIIRKKVRLDGRFKFYKNKCNGSIQRNYDDARKRSTRTVIPGR